MPEIREIQKTLYEHNSMLQLHAYKLQEHGKLLDKMATNVEYVTEAIKHEESKSKVVIFALDAVKYLIGSGVAIATILQILGKI